MSRTTPHAIPLTGPALSLESAKQLSILLREPRPEARREGIAAFHKPEGRDANPYQQGTPEWVSWDAGWNDERQANS